MIGRCGRDTRLKKLFDFVVGYLDRPDRANRVLAVYWVLLLASTHQPGLTFGGAPA